MDARVASAAEPPMSAGGADPARLKAHVSALEGERHPDASPSALARAEGYVEERLAACGLSVRRHVFQFRGRSFANVAAEIPGSDPEAPRVLVGAHLDTVRGTPGADDNASGVAGMLECARLLCDLQPVATVELVAFNLEERQGWHWQVGSRRWAARARRDGICYEGALVLEMIGFRRGDAGTQAVPLPIRWMDLPRTGDFLAAVGDSRSRRLLRAFTDAAAEAAPGLPLVSLHSPLRGWLIWATRRSDHAPFWSRGYPALLLTDTANLRNPHYHGRGDRLETLDLAFMAQVTDAVAACVRALAGKPDMPGDAGAVGDAATAGDGGDGGAAGAGGAVGDVGDGGAVGAVGDGGDGAAGAGARPPG